MNDSKPRPALGVPGAPVSTLRGASAEVDVRSVGRVIACLGAVAVLITIVLLLVAGFEKNAQISRLRQKGVPVEVKVTGCLASWGAVGALWPAMTAQGPSCLTATDTVRPFPEVCSDPLEQGFAPSRSLVIQPLFPRQKSWRENKAQRESSFCRQYWSCCSEPSWERWSQREEGCVAPVHVSSFSAT